MPRPLRAVALCVLLTVCLLYYRSLAFRLPRSYNQSANSHEVQPIPVIIFTYNRADYLRKTLDSVLSTRPDTSLYPIFISQDGKDASITATIASYGAQVTHLKFTWQGKPVRGYRTPYLKIADHYKFALTEVMDRTVGHEKWDRVIILEDDMLVSPDFFSYFRKLAPLFDSDPSLYCVSAWNENGQDQFVSSSTELYRTDCFPGLGWMWSRALWNELGGWTWAFWDDWLREPEQRKGRSCVYPEVNRVYTFGEDGSSSNSTSMSSRFFKKYLKDIRLNNEDVDWSSIETDYLQGEVFEQRISGRLEAAIVVEDTDRAIMAIDNEFDRGVVAEQIRERMVKYTGLQNLTAILLPLGLQIDHKAGIPRGSYNGIVHFRHRGVKIWIVPRS